ncbi:hypothetical protein [Pedobacter agri]|uniref:Uncharacterized protein n=1 Tax=Pedobacter agri TaxID=454586 RepID=A0A9X3IA19_9SPHI|nr:hypothetical protein [Pedobacter agri]MCX3266457.1 hypothetical protein [Pedobacter agri]
MMEDSFKTNYKRHDYRIESLDHIIRGLWEAIQLLEDRVKLKGWYDGLWFREDSEPIFGLAFIALQNYINASIIDRFDSIDGKEKIYKLGNKIGDSGRSNIELIIALANYTKHKDWGEPHKGTREILSDVGLKCDIDVDILEAPIFEGVELLSHTWDLLEVTESVKAWREMLWTHQSL